MAATVTVLATRRRRLSMSLEVSQEDGVAIVRFADAGSMNSLDPSWLRAFRARMTDLLDDEAVRGILLTGTGKAFSAGADVGAFQAGIESGDIVPWILEATEALHGTLVDIQDSATVVVAAVNGVAAGGGLGLALIADARIGCPASRFAAGYFGLGASPDGGATWLLPRLIGVQRTKRFLFENEVMAADEALATGLLDAVVDEDDLLDEAMAWTRRWSAWARHSRQATKRLLAATPRTDLAGQLEAERGLIAASGATPDFAEGIGAFLEKREPRFQ